MWFKITMKMIPLQLNCEELSRTGWLRLKDPSKLQAALLLLAAFGLSSFCSFPTYPQSTPKIFLISLSQGDPCIPTCLICRRMQIDPCVSPCTKLKSKWIKGFNINTDILNWIEEKKGNCCLQNIGMGDNFLHSTDSTGTKINIINGTSWNWDTSVRQRTLWMGRNGSLQIGERHALTPLPIEG